MSLKIIREKLCVIQALHRDIPQDVKDSIQNTLDLIDIHRPLGFDGKHCGRHTPTCGCDDAHNSGYPGLKH